LINGSISCTSKDKIQRTFYYKYTEPLLANPDYELKIYASPDHSDADFFELTAKPKNTKQLKIITIKKNNDSLYGAKGIPDAAIPELIKLSGFGVCSSSQKHPEEPNEFRTEEATKVWKRIEQNGNASYDDATDVYTYMET